MNTSPLVPFQDINRYEKTFEVIQGKDKDLISIFKITKEEAERVFAATGIVPEGTAVKIAVPGTRNGVTYVEGDLEICEADDVTVYGFTYQKVIPIGNDFPYRKKMFQTTGFHGQQVTVAVSSYVAVFRNQFDAGADNATIEGNVGQPMYAGTSGKPSVEGRNGVPSPALGKVIGVIAGTDELPVRHSDGNPVPSADHLEIYVHVNV